MPTDDHDNHPAAVAIASIFERTRQQLEKCHLEYQPVQWLPCHAIDLKKQGELNAHVDSVRFSGDLVAGISLLSPSIMRLMPDNDDSEDKAKEQDTDTIQHLGHVDLFLPPRSLYALTGVGRYRYSHQLLPDASVFTNPTDGVEIKVKRDHRLSIIFRDAKR
jgi:alkylated DNA repair protein alkB family protein 7